MQNLTLALQSTDNLSNLANNLMNFQKEELYSSKVLVTRTHLNEYLSKYLQQFQQYAERKGVSLHFKPASRELKVWIDQNKIDSILRNLLSNALKYTLQGGTVTVEVGEYKGNWTLSISDTGIGIPQKDQKKLFKYLSEEQTPPTSSLPGAVSVCFSLIGSSGTMKGKSLSTAQKM